MPAHVLHMPLKRIVLSCKSEERTPEQSKVTNLINSLIKNANTKLAEYSLRLKHATFYRFSSISFEHENRTCIIALTLIGSNDRKMVRSVIKLTECTLFEDDNETVLTDSNISHIIEVCINENENPFMRNTCDGYLCIHIPILQLTDILVDIAMDIAMSHALHGFHQLSKNTHYCHEFSKRKVEYVKSITSTTPYGTIPADATYASISFISHSGNELDTYVFLDHWKKFCKFIKNHNNPIIASLRFPREKASYQRDVPPIVLNLFEDHPDFHQLPLRSLCKSVMALRPGKYILVRQIRKVKCEKFEGQIEILTAGKPRIGKIRIVDHEDLDTSYANLHNYFSFYYFEK